MTVQKLTKEQVELLQQSATHVNDGMNDWFYLPYWFKRLSVDEFEITQFERLPEKLTEIIKEKHK